MPPKADGGYLLDDSEVSEETAIAFFADEDMEGMMAEEEGNKALISTVTKTGAVLNRSNRDRLNQAKALIDEVLASAEKPPEPGEDEKAIDSQSAEAVRKALRDLAAV